ncbi:MAG: LysM peptidoglycan-binding domain-containing protein [Clostridiales bacterium]|jgi:LysM repeat protein|nr:LysM peptidoglycan-binding domain-containing protein [Clostridiales bacterium]
MQYTVYRIEIGETLEDIARLFNVPSAVILKDNNADNIFPGMRLLIRKNPGKIYYAEPFDTLESIAEKFGTDTEKLSVLNDGLKEVFFGQIIYVPK